MDMNLSAVGHELSCVMVYAGAKETKSPDLTYWFSPRPTECRWTIFSVSVCGA